MRSKYQMWDLARKLRHCKCLSRPFPGMDDVLILTYLSSCTFPLEGQSLGYLFLIEWFVCSYIVSRCEPMQRSGKANGNSLGHRYLDLLGSCQSFRHTFIGTFCDWPSVRCDGKC